MLIWPFFATQVPLVRCAYHPEFLDGLEYYVLSHEVCRRFDADSVSYPVESAYYRWIRANTTVLWKTQEKNSSGPMIEVRRIPPIVSTMAGRDSLFAKLMPTPTTVSRVALWCYDYATVFGRLGDYDRAIEWANRGLKVNAQRLNPKLHSVLAFCFPQSTPQRARGGRGQDRRRGGAPGPEPSPLPRHGLQQMGDMKGALDEYTAAFQISADPRILLNVGAALSALGRYEDAVAALDRVPVGPSGARNGAPGHGGHPPQQPSTPGRGAGLPSRGCLAGAGPPAGEAPHRRDRADRGDEAEGGRLGRSKPAELDTISIGVAEVDRPRVPEGKLHGTLDLDAVASRAAFSSSIREFSVPNAKCCGPFTCAAPKESGPVVSPIRCWVPAIPAQSQANFGFPSLSTRRPTTSR